jgi:hypothetical protein
VDQFGRTVHVIESDQPGIAAAAQPDAVHSALFFKISYDFFFSSSSNVEFFLGLQGTLAYQPPCQTFEEHLAKVVRRSGAKELAGCLPDTAKQ